MEDNKFILVNTLCANYEIEISFIEQLNNFGLIELKNIEHTNYIHKDTLTNLEKMIRLHKDLNINIEGIDVIFNLLEKVENLQNELNYLKNRLLIHEDL